MADEDRADGALGGGEGGVVIHEAQEVDMKGCRRKGKERERLPDCLINIS